MSVRAPAQTLSHCSSPDGARRDGVAGNGRVVRADRRPGEVQRHPDVGRGVHRGPVPWQDGIEARAERVDQLNMARRGLRAGGAEAHLGIRHGRDHDAITAQHRLLGRFSTAAGCSRIMNEQMLVSSIRVSSWLKASFIADHILTFRHKVRIGPVQLRERAPCRPDGTQNDAVPFPDDLQLADAVKIRVPGQTDGAVIAVLNIETVRMDVPPADHV